MPAKVHRPRSLVKQPSRILHGMFCCLALFFLYPVPPLTTSTSPSIILPARSTCSARVPIERPYVLSPPWPRGLPVYPRRRTRAVRSRAYATRILPTHRHTFTSAPYINPLSTPPLPLSSRPIHPSPQLSIPPRSSLSTFSETSSSSPSPREIFHSSSRTPPPTMSRLTFLLLVLAVLLHLASARSNWGAAACCAHGRRCNRRLARMSYSCRPYRWMSSQPWRCRRAACNYCRHANRRYRVSACRARVIRRSCGLGPVRRPPRKDRNPKKTSPKKKYNKPTKKPYTPKKPAPAPKPTKKRSPRGGNRFRTPPAPRGRSGGPRSSGIIPDTCRNPFMGVDRMAISMANFRSRYQWDRVKGWSPISREVNDNGFKFRLDGIVWKKGTDIHAGLSGKNPPKGEMCFKIKFSRGGRYLFSALTVTIRHSENNDLWVKSSAGFKGTLLGGSKTRSFGSGYIKLYQNEVKHVSSLAMSSDFGGYGLFTEVGSGQVFSICIAGRSVHYELYALLLKRCEGDCSGVDIYNRMKKDGGNGKSLLSVPFKMTCS